MIPTTSMLALIVVFTPVERDPCPDLKLLQGSWVLRSYSYRGSPGKVAPYCFLSISGNRFAKIASDGMETRGTLELNDKAQPPEISLRYDGSLVPCVYQLRGDTLKIACLLWRQGRPKDVHGTGRDEVLFYFVRVNPRPSRTTRP